MSIAISIIWNLNNADGVCQVEGRRGDTSIGDTHLVVSTALDLITIKKQY
jgi:hypothetical protein